MRQKGSGISQNATNFFSQKNTVRSKAFARPHGESRFCFTPPAPANDRESPAASEARIQWFREAKFGLFIHWGLYAVTEGDQVER